MIKLTGKRLAIRDLNFTDLEALNYWMQPGRQWQKTDGPYYPRSSAEQIVEKIGKYGQDIAAQNWPTPREQLVVVDAAEDSVVGMVSRYWVSQETNWTAIGIGIYDPKNWGKGYGFEALGLWCQYLFDNESTFVRLDLRTWSGNLGMMKLSEKLGFQKEAVFRMARIVEGKYYDGLGYGVLRTEWETRYPDGFAVSLKADT
jgi:putative hydrolase of HD superfamily